jgi:hypothetical protein
MWGNDKGYCIYLKGCFLSTTTCYEKPTEEKNIRFKI